MNDDVARRRHLRVLRLTSVFEPPRGGLRGAVRFDPVGGMQTHTGELTRALDAFGVRQTVVTTRPPGTARREKFGARSHVLRLGVPVSYARQFWAVPAAGVLPRLAAGVDIVHAHLGEDMAVVPLARWAVRHANAPLVLTVHCSVRYTLPVRDPRTALLKLVGGWWERRGERAAAQVIVLTPRLAGILAAHGVPTENIRVVPSGVRPELFTPTDGRSPADGLPRPRVLFLGRLHAQKSVDVLLEAVALMRRPAHVVLAGDGPERRRLEDLARRRGLDGRVSFLGFVDHDHVPALLRGSDVLVLPSRYEELGTALVEAMHCGVPVIATRTGGIPDVVEHGVSGLLVQPGDVGSLAAALDRVLADPVERRLLGEHGRLAVAEYRWDRLAAQVHDVYVTAIGRRRAR